VARKLGPVALGDAELLDEVVLLLEDTEVEVEVLEAEVDEEEEEELLLLLLEVTPYW
jgi:hypothetical protein